MDPVPGWLPVVWAMRIALFVLLVGCAYVYLLLIAPFFRPAHIVRLLRADLPRVLRFGAEIAGTRAEVELAQEQRTTEFHADAAAEVRKEGMDADQP